MIENTENCKVSRAYEIVFGKVNLRGVVPEPDNKEKFLILVTMFQYYRLRHHIMGLGVPKYYFSDFTLKSFFGLPVFELENETQLEFYYRQ